MSIIRSRLNSFTLKYYSKFINKYRIEHQHFQRRCLLYNFKVKLLPKSVQTISCTNNSDFFFGKFSCSRVSFIPTLTISMNDPIVPYIALFTSTAILGFIISILLNKFNLPYIWKHEIDKASDRHGGELVVEVLKQHGVKHIFTLVGGHISPILVAAEKSGLKVIDTRHEVTAVFAADAVARMTGSVGVAVLTAGPGVTNSVTAIKNAQMAESPVLLIGGAAATLLKGRGALQDIDQLSLFKSLCKFSASVSTVRDIIPTLRKALQIAQSGVPGPVFVELPLDVLYPYKLVVREMKIKTQNDLSIFQKIMNWYLQNYLDNLFAGAWSERDCSPLKVSVPFAKQDVVHKCAEMISKAKKPLFIVGSQATLAPTPVEELKSALERIGVPCFLGGMARGLLGKDSDIQMRHSRREALKEADVILLAGAVCDFRLSYGRSLNKAAKVIAVNRSKEQLTKNSDVFWKPAIPVIGDVGTFMKELASHLESFTCPVDWMNTLKERDEAKHLSICKIADENFAKHLNPLKLLKELDNRLPDNAILVADGGDFIATASYILRPRGSLTWLDPGAFGTLGVGMGFAIGAKLSRPDSEVWVIYGDGSFGYSLIEFDTLVRHKIPVAALVGNDAGWTQIAREQFPMFGSNVACDLFYSDYHLAVKGLGAKGILLENCENTLEAIAGSQDMLREGTPVLVNALIGKTNFRDGSLSV